MALTLQHIVTDTLPADAVLAALAGDRAPLVDEFGPAAEHPALDNALWIGTRGRPRVWALLRELDDVPQAEWGARLYKATAGYGRDGAAAAGAAFVSQFLQRVVRGDHQMRLKQYETGIASLAGFSLEYGPLPIRVRPFPSIAQFTLQLCDLRFLRV